MAKLLDLCDKYYGARDFYEVLKIEKTASDKEVKKAYHKLSLLVHPDRVSENIKDEATEKFKVLGQIHSILSDKDKRKIYDETGDYDEESSEVVTRNWADYWKTLFKPITEDQIREYHKNYTGSEAEMTDLKNAYLKSKGDMDYIVEAVPFVNCEDEPRVFEIIQKLIISGELPEYKSFTEESEKKKERRRKKWAKDTEEFEKLSKKQKIQDENSLVLQIQQRNKDRAGQAENFFDSLIDKYAKKAEPKKRATNKASTSSARKTKKKN